LPPLQKFLREQYDFAVTTTVGTSRLVAKLRSHLTALDAATQPQDLAAIPSWRLTFIFEGTDAVLLDYEDYHQERRHEPVHNPCHPGEVLKEALSDISVTDAAQRLGVGRVALSRLLNGATAISPEMAMRLSKALGTSPEFWYGMQVNYDLWQAKRKFRGKVRPIVQRESAGG
jgi:addiction module HigA family antidote